jgi:hypothetical protein
VAQSATQASKRCDSRSGSLPQVSVATPVPGAISAIVATRRSVSLSAPRNTGSGGAGGGSAAGGGAAGQLRWAWAWTCAGAGAAPARRAQHERGGCSTSAAGAAALAVALAAALPGSAVRALALGGNHCATW